MRRGRGIDRAGNEFDLCAFYRESAEPPTTMYAIREVTHVGPMHALANGWVTQPTFDVMFGDRVTWQDADPIDEGR